MIFDLLISLLQDFVGNTDRNTVVYNKVKPPITTRYIRFRPLAWHTHITMRVELYGCLLGSVEGFPKYYIKLLFVANNIIKEAILQDDDIWTVVGVESFKMGMDALTVVIKMFKQASNRGR